ncbi:MAG TPA: hypothetical protein VN132_13315 [Bdellovibrio sp.]|nr:hypothetical protein [Bdellovibrio sp.]
MKNKLERWIPHGLLLVGLICPLGFLLNSTPLKGLGLAWMISPLPIVFSDSHGYEAFSSKYSVTFTLVDGAVIEKAVTFKEARLLQGPYNRRNVYGAVIGYFPRLPQKMTDSVLHYGFCQSKTLLREFQLPSDVRKYVLHVAEGAQGRENQHQEVEGSCPL